MTTINLVKLCDEVKEEVLDKAIPAEERGIKHKESEKAWEGRFEWVSS